MHNFALPFFVVALVAGCVPETVQSDNAPANTNAEEYPGVLEIAPFTFENIPKLGTLTLIGGRESVTLDVVDFSIGAVDPSAWFQTIDQQATFTMTAYDAGDTNLDGYGALRLRAEFDAVGVGQARSAVMTIFTDTFDRPSTAPAYEITSFEITSISAAPPNSLDSYRRVQGVIKGRGCPTGKPCLDINGTFDTIASVDG